METVEGGRFVDGAMTVSSRQADAINVTSSPAVNSSCRIKSSSALTKPLSSTDLTLVADSAVTNPLRERGNADDAPEPVVKGAFCELVKEARGDPGGSEQWSVSKLKQARDELLNDE